MLVGLRLRLLTALPHVLLRRQRPTLFLELRIVRNLKRFQVSTRRERCRFLAWRRASQRR
jgi:hypothetical protein